jgi:hypothetical protein
MRENERGIGWKNEGKGNESINSSFHSMSEKGNWLVEEGKGELVEGMRENICVKIFVPSSIG